jgi:nicotinamidase-related amidase
VVIDMIPFFVDENPYALGVITNIESLAATLRTTGGPVAWVVPVSEEPTEHDIGFFDPSIASRYSASTGTHPPRDRITVHHQVASSDLVVEKRHPGAFFPGSSELDTILTNGGIDTILITGTVANVCCESTAREAATLGYRVVMVADGNAAGTDAELNATLQTIYRSFGDVRPTSEIVELLGCANG